MQEQVVQPSSCQALSPDWCCYAEMYGQGINVMHKFNNSNSSYIHGALILQKLSHCKDLLIAEFFSKFHQDKHTQHQKHQLASAVGQCKSRSFSCLVLFLSVVRVGIQLLGSKPLCYQLLRPFSLVLHVGPGPWTQNHSRGIHH